MIAPAVALQVALATASVGSAGHDLTRGQTVVTRLEHPLCADRLDLQNYFGAVVSGDMALQLDVGGCAPLHDRHEAVVIKVLPGRGIVNLRVTLGQRRVEGYMSSAGLRVP